METISYTAFRRDLASILDKVEANHAPVIITRQNGSDAVVMSLTDYHSYAETAALMASAYNAQRLSAAIEEIEGHKATLRPLIEDDSD